AGDVALDAEAAAAAIDRLGAELDLGRLETAAGILRVANQEMVRALRVVTVERGVDPRGFALLPFGGAGPMHAAAIAAELGIETILCPRAGGVLSAFGLCASERRRDTTRTVMLSGEELSAERIAATVATMVTATGAGLEDAETGLIYALRYAGQAFELPVPGSAQPDPRDLAERFERAHEERYGHRDPEGEVVLVDIRLALAIPGPQATPRAATGAGLERTSREVRFDEGWVQTPVLRGEPAAGTAAEGPVIFELPEATLVLPPGWSASVDEHGTICAEVAL
ncbi:MAG: hydantoinase/oxoprolinase family protein, partial [Thermoleophilia bacterium]|nr:hydantoinase/oxoprolinase family protein [Thermoleophilia bacterium]